MGVDQVLSPIIKGNAPDSSEGGNLSQEITQPPAFPSTHLTIEKIHHFFDLADVFMERSDKLLTKSKSVVVNLFLFVHLLIDLIVVLTVLRWKCG